MKKLITISMVLLLTFGLAGCGKKDPNKPSNPTPKPDKPVETVIESALGNRDGIDNYNIAFKEDHNCAAFMYTFNESDNVGAYYVFEDNRVYMGNYRDFIQAGQTPLVNLTVYYDEFAQIRSFSMWLPDSNILDVTEKQAEKIVQYQKGFLKTLLPDAKDDDIKKIISKLSLTLEDGFEAYRNGSAEPSQLTKTEYVVNVKARTPETQEGTTKTFEYKLTFEYTDEYKTMVLKGNLISE